MPSELTLFFTDENGFEQQVVVQTNPFTIGRQEGNTLVLRDTGLSRRHALITSFGEVAQVSDCGSQNGTYLNGQLLTSAAVLKNGDVIGMGEQCKLRVQIRASLAAAAREAPSTPVSHAAVAAPPSATIDNRSTAALPKLSPTMIAIVATIAIVVVAGVLIGVVVWRKSKQPVDKQDIVFVDSSASPATTDSPSSAATTEPATASSNQSAGVDQFEKTLIQVIRNISNDPGYAFPSAVVADLKRRAAQYATPTLAGTLRSIATRGDDTLNQIRGQGLKKPALLVFMALAETNGGGDPLAMARQLVPEVQFLRGHFGSEFADPTLMLVAASKIPGGSKKSHPLLASLRQLVKNPQTDRNVWFLRDKGALSDAAYDYVLRFLAYGAIAQNPRQFGLDAPALVF